MAFVVDDGIGLAVPVVPYPDLKSVQVGGCLVDGAFELEGVVGADGAFDFDVEELVASLIGREEADACAVLPKRSTGFMSRVPWTRQLYSSSTHWRHWRLS